jgi:ferredoxin-like protein FixX
MTQKSNSQREIQQVVVRPRHRAMAFHLAGFWQCSVSEVYRRCLENGFDRVVGPNASDRLWHNPQVSGYTITSSTGDQSHFPDPKFDGIP